MDGVVMLQSLFFRDVEDTEEEGCRCIVDWK